jgi:hypothetical protein
MLMFNGHWGSGSEYVDLLGLNSIIIKKGIYPVDLSVGEFGQATFDLITE